MIRALAHALFTAAFALSSAPLIGADDPPQAAPPSTAAHGKESKTEPPATPHFQDTVTVVAPPIAEKDRASALSGLVTEVTSRQIMDEGAHDLATAIRRVPGVSISRYNPVGSYGGADGGAIYVRGQGSGRPGAEISTLTDGIPRFVGVWTHPLLDVMDVDAADRIEVMRGAQPVLLGTMAFGAVNVVPRRVTAPGYTTRLATEGGSFSTFGARAEHGGRVGPWDYLVSAGRRESEGHRPGAGGAVDAATGRVGVNLGAGWQASVYTDWTDSWAEDPGRQDDPAPPVRPRFGVRDTFAEATLAHELGGLRGTVKLYRDDGAIDWRQWDGTRHEAFVTATDWLNTGLRLRERIALAEGSELLLGFDHDVYGGRAEERRPAGTVPQVDLSFRNDAPYAAVSVRLASAPELTVAAGVRYNRSRSFGSDWAGQGGLTARIGGTELYANAARGFNLPGVWVASFYAGWGRGDAWRDLEPERIDHVEAGVIQALGPNIHLTASLFRDRVDNALRFVPPPPPPPAFANIGRYTVRGGELTVTAEPGEGIAFFAGVAHAATTPADVPNAPRWSASGAISWAPAARLRVSLDGQWVDAQWVLNPRFPGTNQRVGAYTVLNGTMRWRLPRWGASSWSLHLTLENLANTDYEVRPGYPMPGRSLLAGVDVGL